jgi:hypothetical protein
MDNLDEDSYYFHHRTPFPRVLLMIMRCVDGGACE